ncbi:MAG: FKBP-type peptidyl-prolyl cis-trans isomerase N-terminal domain-containing protein [Flavobacteriales bacterium]
MTSKKILIMLSVGVLSFTSQAQKKGTVKPATNTASTPVVLKTETDSASYALGILIAKNLMAQGIDTLNTQALAEAMKLVLGEKAVKFTDAQAQQIATTFAQELKKAQGDKNLKTGEAFLAKNKTRPGVVTTASGLQYEVIKQGPDGPKPGPTSKCKAHYHGTLLNGTVFDSSVERGQPLPVSCNGVIKAWTEALQMMTVGTKLKIYCHPSIAYGLNGSPPKIGANEVLIFEMELISIDQP